MLLAVWISAAGTTYRAAAHDLINAQILFCYSGSWQVAILGTKIGDAFEWATTRTPCLNVGGSCLARRTALMGIKYTKNPEEVAQDGAPRLPAGGEGVIGADGLPPCPC